MTMTDEEIDALIPTSLKQAIATHGLAKIAAQMFGVAAVTEKSASEIIGTKLMQRTAEWRNIRSGLMALEDLKKE